MPIAGWVEKRDVAVHLDPDLRAPIPFDTFDLGSWKAIWSGEASPHQQKRFGEWLLYALRGHESSFQGEATHAMAFAEGQRKVYLQLVRMLNARIPEEKDGRRS